VNCSDKLLTNLLSIDGHDARLKRAYQFLEINKNYAVRHTIRRKGNTPGALAAMRYITGQIDSMWCTECKVPHHHHNPIQLHHIDMDHKNYNPTNLVFLCRKCHAVKHGKKVHNMSIANVIARIEVVVDSSIVKKLLFTETQTMHIHDHKGCEWVVRDTTSTVSNTSKSPVTRKLRKKAKKRGPVVRNAWHDEHINELDTQLSALLPGQPTKVALNAFRQKYPQFSTTAVYHKIKIGKMKTILTGK